MSESIFEIEELKDNEEIIDEENEAASYFCNSCEINFTCLDEHIRKFHKNDRISVETRVESPSEETYEEHELMEVVDDEEETSEETYCKVERLEDYPEAIENVSENKELEDGTQTMDGNEETEIYLEEEDDPTEGTSQPEQQISLASQKKSKRKTKLQVKEEEPSVKAVIKKVRCEESSKELTFESSFKNNIKTQRTEQTEIKFECSICKTQFNTQKQYKLHAKIHKNFEILEKKKKINVKSFENPEIDNIVCHLCNKTFHSLELHEIHLKGHEGNNTNLVLPKGELKITDKSLANKAKYPCKFCGKEFIRAHEKVKHEMVHTGEKPFSCDECGKCFRVSYCLTLHKRTHSEERPFVCANCDKRFKSQSVYNHHLKTHSNVKNYQCPFCTKCFKTSVQLSGHKNTHLKPFSCTYCSRAFGTMYAVRIHMESHKKDNSNFKYVCGECGAVYARDFALKDHIREAHPDVVDEEIQEKTVEVTNDTESPLYQNFTIQEALSESNEPSSTVWSNPIITVITDYTD